MTRLWLEGEWIAMTLDAEGRPSHFLWRGVTHHVQGIAKVWRVDEEWWRQRIWREYVKLYTREGLLLILYRDLLTERWFVQRLYD